MPKLHKNKPVCACDRNVPWDYLFAYIKRASLGARLCCQPKTSRMLRLAVVIAALALGQTQAKIQIRGDTFLSIEGESQLAPVARNNSLFVVSTKKAIH